jgi:Choline/ethanolamine kinase
MIAPLVIYSLTLHVCIFSHRAFSTYPKTILNLSNGQQREQIQVLRSKITIGGIVLVGKDSSVGIGNFVVCQNVLSFSSPFSIYSRGRNRRWFAVSGEFAYCHNDLSRHNILVDPNSLKINAIYDWEYSGFYPEYFEGQFYTRWGLRETIEDEVDNRDIAWKGSGMRMNEMYLNRSEEANCTT